MKGCIVFLVIILSMISSPFIGSAFAFGDVIEEKCYRLRVLSAAHRRVERVAVERLDELTDATKKGHCDSLPSATHDHT